MTHDETPDDAVLLQRFCDGDDEAFVAFVELHHAALERWLSYSLESGADVDDLVQETFLAVMKSATQFRGASSGRTWLFGIARNRLGRHFRRRAGEPATFEPLDELGLRAGWGDPETTAVRSEEVELVHRALRRLTAHEAEILILRDIEGFTTTETAELLDLTIPATKSRLHRARLALMAQLRATEGPDG